MIAVRNRGRRGRLSAVTILLATAVITIAPAQAASADTEYAFNWVAPANTTIEYGEGWSFNWGSNYVKDAYWATGIPRVVVHGARTGWTPDQYQYATPGLPVYAAPQQGSVFSSSTQRPLDAGTYTFDVILDRYAYSSSQYFGQTPAPATLTVTPAALGIEVRILADEGSENGAIVTARFTGDFVENYSTTGYSNAPLSPAGTWQISIADATGAEIIAYSVARTELDDVLATSAYWAQAKPGETYTATATFAAAGQTAENFAIAAATAFDYTAPDIVRPIPVSAATEKPVEDQLPAPDFSVPLWWTIVIALALAALIALTVVTAIRLGRAPRRGAPVNDKDPADVE